MRRRGSTLILTVLAIVAGWLVSCREVHGPSGGVFSASPLILPAPGIVAGDTMRDSLGLVAPLQVIAFDVAGDTIQNAMPTFVVIDTGAHLVGALLVGDSVGRTVRIVGTVGSVQTRPESVTVTLSPDTLVAADSLVRRATYSIANGDTAATSSDLSTFVQHVGASLTGVRAVVVRYTIDKAPTGDPAKGPVIVLLNSAASAISTRDTTDASGKAAVRARFRIAPLGPTFAVDTALVSATASYRGRTLGVVQFTIVFTNQ